MIYFGAAAGCCVVYCLWQRYANGFVGDGGEVGGLDGAVVAEATEEAGAKTDDVLAVGEVGDGGGAYCGGVVAGLSVGSFEAEGVVANAAEVSIISVESEKVLAKIFQSEIVAF